MVESDMWKCCSDATIWHLLVVASHQNILLIEVHILLLLQQKVVTIAYLYGTGIMLC